MYFCNNNNSLLCNNNNNYKRKQVRKKKKIITKNKFRITIKNKLLKKTKINKTLKKRLKTLKKIEGLHLSLLMFPVKLLFLQKKLILLLSLTYLNSKIKALFLQLYQDRYLIRINRI